MTMLFSVLVAGSFLVYGASSDACIRQPIVNLGDLDGDGIADVAVLSQDLGGSRAIVLSGASGKSVHEIGISQGRKVLSAAAFDDVDGDKIPDFVLGFANGQKMYACVYSGKEGKQISSFEWRVPQSSSADGDPDERRLYAALARGADYSGNGVGDLLVLVSNPDALDLLAVQIDTGETVFKYGSKSGWQDGERSFLLDVGPISRTTEFVPGTLALLPDVDGDSVAEIIIGRPTPTLTGPGAGRAGAILIVSPGKEKVLRRHSGKMQVAPARQAGLGRKAQDIHSIGYIVQAAGDWDGDSVIDYLGTAWSEGVCVYSGADGEVIWEIDYCRGLIAGEGASVGLVYEAGGSAPIWIAVGTNDAEEGWESPTPAPIYPAARGASEANSTPIHHIESGRFGVSVCASDDINGDGTTDLVCFLVYERVVKAISGRSFELLWSVNLPEGW